MDFDSAVAIDLAKLLQEFPSILEDEIWPGLQKPISAEEVSKEVRRFVPYKRKFKPYNPIRFKAWSRVQHAKRIAYFMINGFEAVSMDFGCPSLGASCFFSPINDGHHRLLAAIFRGDRFIMANCGGEEGYIEEFLYTA